MNKTILDKKMTYCGIPAYCEVIKGRFSNNDFYFIDSEGNVKSGRFGEAGQDAKIYDEYIKVVVYANRVEATCNGETASFIKDAYAFKSIVDYFTCDLARWGN